MSRARNIAAVLGSDGLYGSADVTAALGYTPVNKAGDIMTGALRVNSSSGPHRVSVSDGPSTDRGYLEWVSGVEGVVLMNTDNSPLQLGTNGVKDRIKIDYLGRVTTPYQPAFHVYDSTGTTWGQTIVKPNTIITNRGNCYNPATGLFTAPVAGFYHFRADWRTSGGGDWMDIRSSNGNLARHEEVSTSFNFYHNTLVMNCYLNAGDTAYVYAGSQVRWDINSTDSFSGFLIG